MQTRNTLSLKRKAQALGVDARDIASMSADELRNEIMRAEARLAAQRSSRDAAASAMQVVDDHDLENAHASEASDSEDSGRDDDDGKTTTVDAEVVDAMNAQIQALMAQVQQLQLAQAGVVGRAQAAPIGAQGAAEGIVRAVFERERRAQFKVKYSGGDDFVAWFRKLRCHIRRCNLDDDAAYDLVADQLLTGGASTKFENARARLRDFATLEAWLVEQFAAVGSYVAADDTVTQFRQKKSERAVKAALRLQALVDAREAQRELLAEFGRAPLGRLGMPLTDTEILTAALAGLDVATRRRLAERGAPPDSLATMIVVLEQSEQWELACGIRTEPTSTSAEACAKVELDADGHPQTHDREPWRRQGGARNRGGRRGGRSGAQGRGGGDGSRGDGKADGKRFRGKCFNCQKFGHMARDCRRGPVQQTHAASTNEDEPPADETDSEQEDNKQVEVRFGETVRVITEAHADADRGTTFVVDWDDDTTSLIAEVPTAADPTDERLVEDVDEPEEVRTLGATQGRRVRPLMIQLALMADTPNPVAISALCDSGSSCCVLARSATRKADIPTERLESAVPVNILDGASSFEFAHRSLAKYGPREAVINWYVGENETTFQAIVGRDGLAALGLWEDITTSVVRPIPNFEHEPNREPTEICAGDERDERFFETLFTATVKQAETVPTKKEPRYLRWQRLGVSMLAVDGRDVEGKKAIARCSSALTQAQCAKLREIISENRDAFARNPCDLGDLDVPPFQFNMKPGARPYRARPRKFDPKTRGVVRATMEMWCAMGVMERGYSEWASPVTVVAKGENDARVCTASMDLNSKTQPVVDVLPRFEDVAEFAVGAKCFATFDFTNCYNQVRVHPDSLKYGAVVTEDGQFIVKRMLYGWRESMNHLTRVLSEAFRDFDEWLIIYVDDVLIKADSIDELFERIRVFLKRVRKLRAKLSLDKADLCSYQVKYLGRMVSGTHVGPDEDYQALIGRWRAPRDRNELAAFLSSANWLRTWIANLADATAPMRVLLRKDVRWKWTPLCQRAFDEVKSRIARAKPLTLPRRDWLKIIQADASNYATGGALLQAETADGPRQVCAFYSRGLTDTQRRWPINKTELLSVVECCEHWRGEVIGAKFRVETDHRNLIFSMASDKGLNSLLNWRARLAPFWFEAVHLPGKDNFLADWLSRGVDFSETDEVVRASQSEWVAAPRRSVRRAVAESRRSHEATDEVPVGEADPLPCAMFACEAEYTDPTMPRTHEDEFTQRWSLQQWRDEQKADPIGGLIGKVLGHEADVSVLPRGMQRAFKQQRFEIDESGLLRGYGRIFVPASMRAEVLTTLHEGSGHVGRAKMEGLMVGRFYWPGCLAECGEHCSTCEACATGKSGGAVKSAGRAQVFPAHAPFEVIQIDLVGQLPTRFEKRWYLTIQDRFSRVMRWVALDTADADTVFAELRNWTSDRGLPRSLLSDRGSQFTGAVATLYHECYGLQRMLTTADRPSTNGGVERGHRTVEESAAVALAADGISLADCDFAELDRRVQAAVYVHNSTPHRAFGFKYSPMDVANGRRCRIPTDELLQFAEDTAEASVSDPRCAEFAESLAREAQAIRAAALAAQERYTSQLKEEMDLRRTDAVEFEEGEWALRRTRIREEWPRKFGPRFEKVRIRGRLGPNTYSVEKAGTNGRFTVNVADLKKMTFF